MAAIAALDCAAVVRKAGTLKDRPELFTVHATPFAVRAVFNPTASVEPLAVVRKAGTFSDRPELFTVQATPFAVSAVFSPIASVEARAVVRYAPGGCAVVSAAG
jgi:predicted naringenin-chalcone synthase